MPDLRPGNLIDPDVEDYDAFDNSLAQAIEDELDDLLGLDGLPLLPKNTVGSRSARPPAVHHRHRPGHRPAPGREPGRLRRHGSTASTTT